MRRLRFNVAVSLDGFIARLDGSFDWIVEDPSIDFDALLAEFDTLLMGRKTFEVLQSQGSGGPFWEMQKVVVSRTLPSGENGSTQFVCRDVVDHIRGMKEGSGRDIWLFGGGELFRHLLDAGLVDTVEVALMPVLLSAGIPMLAVGDSSTRLSLTNCETLKSGIVMLRYDVHDRAA
jgi:dihydrofolate reductase